ncbi:uncharacterized protein LOC111199438 [Brassica napus]|uniref:uncharacterized protein LOC111199438 n=1 Tax=Brassica napus TaxID=3708 RepID=UPI002078F60D|nr:uncharacterized protein LOC111199438 [Brassica napus]
MDTKINMTFTKIQNRMITIILLCLLVSSSSEAAPQTQLAIPLEPTGEVISSPKKPLGLPVENQNQPILGQPSSTSSVNQPLTGSNQPSTGFNQPSSTELNQPILGQPSSSSVNQPLTGFNQPSSTGFNQPSSNSALSRPFASRTNQNSLSGNNVPFINGNSKLDVSTTKIVFICIAFLVALHGTGIN